MNEKRMLDRGIIFKNKRSGILNEYKMVINKKSYKNPDIGYANVIKDKDSIVEGVLYEVDNINKLDKYEGYPVHYRRELLDIISNGDIVSSVVYVANDKWVTDDELLTTLEYKNHLLEGKKYLSDDYYKILEKIKII